MKPAEFAPGTHDEPMPTPGMHEPMPAALPAPDAHDRRAPMPIALLGVPSPIMDVVTKLLRRIEPMSQPYPIRSLERAALGPDTRLVVVDGDALPDGIERCVSQLPASGRGLVVVVLGQASDPRSVQRALHAGASAYLPKRYSEPLLESMLRSVLGRLLRVPHEHGNSLFPERQPWPQGATPAPARRVSEEHAAGLTRREVQVLTALTSGASNFQIGKRLGVSEGTVKCHMFKIFAKLGVQTRAEAALVAVRLPAVQGEQLHAAQHGRLDPAWFQTPLVLRRLRCGQRVFALGDQCDGLYYVHQGTIRLEELGIELGTGDVFGESEAFTAGRSRIYSAICTTDADLFTVNEEQARRTAFFNPQFALFLLNVMASRLSHQACRGRPAGKPLPRVA